MAIITTGLHPKALWPGVHAWFGTNYEQHSQEWKDLVEVATSDKAYEEDVLNAGFGLVPVKKQGAGLYYDSDQQGPVSRYTHVVYAMGYIVTMEELADNLYKEKSFKRARMLAYSTAQTKENVVANVYNRAFNSSYTGADGVSMINSAHPQTSGANQSNVLATATALSETALEDLLVQIGKAEDPRGLKISLKAQRLVIPVDLTFTAQRILKSTLQNDTANNAINAIREMGLFPQGVSVNHYLSSATAYFIRTDCPESVRLFERAPYKFEQDNDFDTKNAKASAYERYSVGWSDFRGVYGTPGA